MKYIIDISEDTHTECQGHIYFPDTGAELFDAVKNGTTFDSVIEDIKAEIEHHCNITVGSYNEPAMILHDIFKIIDKCT